MAHPHIAGVVAAQTALIDALDGGDVAAIEAATTAVSQAVLRMRACGVVSGISRDELSYALKQSEAARTRVNFLADRTRQRLDRLAERRGVRHAATYNSAGVFAVFKG